MRCSLRVHAACAGYVVLGLGLCGESLSLDYPPVGLVLSIIQDTHTVNVQKWIGRERALGCESESLPKGRLVTSPFGIVRGPGVVIYSAFGISRLYLP